MRRIGDALRASYREALDRGESAKQMERFERRMKELGNRIQDFNEEGERELKKTEEPQSDFRGIRTP